MVPRGGATGSYFTTFVLLANPNDADASVTMTYLPDSGAPITTTYTIPGQGRLTINIADEDPSLASAAIATRVSGSQPIVVERAQYRPNPVWHEAHGRFGATAAATRWAAGTNAQATRLP